MDSGGKEVKPGKKMFYFIRNENHKLKRPALEGFAPSFLNNMIKNRNATSLSLICDRNNTYQNITFAQQRTRITLILTLSLQNILMVLFKMKCSLYLPRNYVFPFASNKT